MKRRELIRGMAGLALLAAGSTAHAQQNGGRITVRAVGDVMMHETQLRAGRTGGGYDFRPWFASVRDLISGADLAMGNLETVLGGQELRFTGYPTFNSPVELGEAVKWAGFRVMTTANNHCMDRGETGVLRTIQALDRLGLLHTGTFASQASRDAPLLVDVKGMRLGILAYTFSTNGIPVPKPYLSNRIDVRLVARDAAAARAAGAEFVIACVHWGDEYQRQPNETQRSQARSMIQGGVDLIFGSHPHVVQPMERITAGTRTGWVYYSMGNFVSGQRGSHKDEGIIAHVELARTPAGIKIDKASYIPTYVEKSSSLPGEYRVLVVQEALKTTGGGELAARLRAAWESTVALMNTSRQ